MHGCTSTCHCFCRDSLANTVTMRIIQDFENFSFATLDRKQSTKSSHFSNFSIMRNTPHRRHDDENGGISTFQVLAKLSKAVILLGAIASS
jgi:hypothetical protein